MSLSKRKEFAGFLGALLSVSVLLIPFHMMQTHPAQAAQKKLPEQNVISTEYAQEGKLFDSDRVHTINLHISDENWNYMTSHALEEKYVTCDAEIDGELFQNIAIRPKGNSSLTSIKNQGSTHFSFKIEFDHNDPAVTYHGLDKLSLDNLGQDPSCMKDFFAYYMMNEMNVPAPLSSYTLVKLNGEEFGLYLAAEAVEDSFCYRNYGNNFGTLYKHIASLQYVGENEKDYSLIFDTTVFDITEADKRRLIDAVKILNTSDTPTAVLDTDTLLRYFAVHNFVNNYDGYTSMFVHNFYLHEKDGILSMIPWDYNLAFGSFNYESAVSSIISKDTGFDAIPDTGNAMNINQSMINYPIDTPLYSLEMSSRPLVNALLSDESTLEAYHQIFDELLTTCFENGRYDKLYEQTYENIRPYVEQGLTFYDISKFEQGSEMIHKYCQYRAESVRGQLDGSIPSTDALQLKNPDSLIQPEGLDVSRLADFGSLLPLLDADTIIGVIHVFLQNDFTYNTNGAVEAIHYYVNHPLKLVGRVPALMQIDTVREIAVQKLLPILLIFTAFLTLLIVVIVKLIRRRKHIKSQNP